MERLHEEFLAARLDLVVIREGENEMSLPVHVRDPWSRPSITPPTGRR